MTPSQRKALDFSPDLDASTAPSIVRLLVMSTTVMMMTLRMDGKNLKGVGQFGLAVRKYP